MAEKEWEQLSLDEKLTELGFVRSKDAEATVTMVDAALATTEFEERLHAALDQLMDAGGLLNEIEVLVKPAATGVVGADVPGEMTALLKRIHELVTAEE